MELREPSDLTNIPFDEFVSLIFDRDIPPKAGRLDASFYDVGVEFDAQKMCAYYVQLFHQPEFLVSRFTRQQLEEGFWAIIGHTVEWSMANIIDDSNLPLSSRKDCIESMAVLFERLFANEPLDTSVHMWWDSLCNAWHRGHRNRERGGEDLELQDIFFQTLSKVLAINSWICQGAALHGLGHLHHPRTKELVNRYLDENPSLNTGQKAYALAAAEFQVL